MSYPILVGIGAFPTWGVGGALPPNLPAWLEQTMDSVEVKERKR